MRRRRLRSTLRLAAALPLVLDAQPKHPQHVNPARRAVRQVHHWAVFAWLLWVMTIDYDVIDVHELDHNTKYDLLADMHLATPERSLMVARALGVLPPIVWMVGVQPVDAETMKIGMSTIVEQAIDVAIVEIDRCVAQLMAGATA